MSRAQPRPRPSHLAWICLFTSLLSACADSQSAETVITIRQQGTVPQIQIDDQTVLIDRSKPQAERQAAWRMLSQTLQAAWQTQKREPLPDGQGEWAVDTVHLQVEAQAPAWIVLQQLGLLVSGELPGLVERGPQAALFKRVEWQVDEDPRGLFESGAWFSPPMPPAAEEDEADRAVVELDADGRPITASTARQKPAIKARAVAEPFVDDSFHVRILPSGYQPKQNPSHYQTWWDELGQAQDITIALGSTRQLSVPLADLQLPLTDPKRQATEQAIQEFLREVLAISAPNPMTVHCFSQLPWQTAAVVWRLAHELAPERRFALAPARIGGYRRWELGYELFELIHLK